MRFDREIYERIVNEAREALGRTKTNPLVGAALVDSQNQVRHITHHDNFGGPHAEAKLFDQVKEIPPGSKLYTTLEPCLHPGKTSSCLERIVNSSLDSLVYGMRDPSPAVNGRSITSLEEMDFAVEGPVDKGRYRWLIRSYIHNQATGFPWVEGKAALSVDGYLAMVNRNSQWITSEASRNFGHRLRSRVDAVMIGAQTLRSDNPQLTDRVTGSDHQPRPVVVARNVDNLPLDSHLLSKRCHECVVVLPDERFSHPAVTELENRGTTVIFGDLSEELLDWNQILPRLVQLGIGRILVEGGGMLLGSLSRLGLINEFHLFYSGRIFGEGVSSFRFHETLQDVEDANNLGLIQSEQFENDVYVRRLDTETVSTELNEAVLEQLEESWMLSC